MKRCFHRALWGKYHTSKKDSGIIKRRARCDEWIKKIINHKYKHPFRTYVFGEDNYKHLEDLGVTDLILVDKNPAPFDLLTEQYRHKLESIKACYEDGYEEVMHVDWDAIPQKPIDEEFWKIMRKGQGIQANLQQYRRIKCRWRKRYSKDLRKVPNGGFFYTRGKEHIEGVIKCWEKRPGNSCEPPMGMYVEELMGGKWLGTEEYWDMGFEAMTCILHRSSVFGRDEDKVSQKNIYFKHYQG